MMVGAAGRRRIRARRASPPRSGQKLHVAQRRGDPLGRPRSFMPTRSFTAGTNKSRGVPRMVGAAGRRRIRARPNVPRPRSFMPTRPAKQIARHAVCQRRGDPLGRPRSFMPTRSFMAGTNKSRGAMGAGRRRIRARHASPPGSGQSPMCANVGATHWVALGHSCQRARSWPGQTNREACLGMVGERGVAG